MSAQSWEKFIFTGSPFIPQLPQGFLDSVKAQVVADQSPPQLVIAKDLLIVGSSHHQYLIRQMNELYPKFGTTGNDLFYYILGFSAPLVSIAAAFFTELHGPEVAQKYIDDVPADSEETRKFNAYIQANRERCHNLLLEDTTCARIFEHLVAQPFRQQVYYRVGMESAKGMFATSNIMLSMWFGGILGIQR